MPFSEQQFDLIVIGGGLAGEGAIDEARACWLRCSLSAAYPSAMRACYCRTNP